MTTETLKRYVVAPNAFAMLCEACTLQTIQINNEDIDLDHADVDDESGKIILSHEEYVALGGKCDEGGTK